MRLLGPSLEFPAVDLPVGQQGQLIDEEQGVGYESRRQEPTTAVPRSVGTVTSMTDTS